MSLFPCVVLISQGLTYTYVAMEQSFITSVNSLSCICGHVSDFPFHGCIVLVIVVGGSEIYSGKTY